MLSTRHILEYEKDRYREKKENEKIVLPQLYFAPLFPTVREAETFPHGRHPIGSDVRNK